MATDQNTNPPKPDQSHAGIRATRGRTSIFFYDLAVLAALFLVGALYLFEKIKLPEAATVLLSIQSAWFGALGGVIISLKGIYDHADGPGGWDRSFNLWHFGRPVSGAVAGLMTVVLLSTTISDPSKLTTPVVFSAAFIFGTQERRFFNLLYEVARLIVQVPDDVKSAGLRVTDIQPSEGSAGGVVVITGQGIEPGVTVKLGSAAVEKLTIAGDGTSAAGLIPIRPMSADTVDVVVANTNGASFVLANKFKYVG
jgi:hypothetical protein